MRYWCNRETGGIGRGFFNSAEKAGWPHLPPQCLLTLQSDAVLNVAA
jgi:hypothetical protein